MNSKADYFLKFFPFCKYLFIFNYFYVFPLQLAYSVLSILIWLRKAIPIPWTWTGEAFPILDSPWLSLSSLESVMCVQSLKKWVFLGPGVENSMSAKFP